MRKILPIFLGITLVLTVAFAFLLHSKNASAEVATYLVISEIQVAGAASGEDFIELYNPTSSAINLGDFRLVKRTGSGTSDDSIVAFNADDEIPAHGYFLWCNSSLSATLSCDRATSATVANNNSVGLREGDLDIGILVDAVSFGSVTNPLGEGTSLLAPSASSSVERKANNLSTTSSMGAGGADELMGNAWDTNDNSSDFVSRSLSQAQNSGSASEPIGSPSPTSEPSMTPEPTEEPTSTPIPSPSVIPSPEPTSIPSATPTTQPSPTITLVPTSQPTPTEIPSPTPTKGPKVVTKNTIITCTLNYKPIKAFNKTYFFPIISCARTSR